jgi:signal transduction histidine kinase
MADGHLLAADPDPAEGGGSGMRGWRADAAVAGALIVLGLLRIPLALLINDGRFPSPVWVVAVGTLASTLDFATIGLRRRAPRLALGIATATVLAATALPAAYQLTGIGVLVCAYTAATLLPRRQTMILLGLAAALHAIGGIVSVWLGGRVDLVATYWANSGDSAGSLVLASLATFALPGLIGLYIGTHRAYTAELARRVDRLESERELREAAAAAEERGRIARELHDIAAHDLSAIVVQAGAADRLLDREPDRARDALRSIRSQGRRTLTAMRELVGVLRTTDTADVPPPQPSLSTLDTLVTAARQTGMTVSLRIRGSVASLSPATDVAAYRLVQEAVTNARQHAPGAAVDITVDYRENDVTLTVHNGPGAPPDGVPSEGGHGLLGMRERVRHRGGDLTVGPTDGGWEVVARLPVGDPT